MSAAAALHRLRDQLRAALATVEEQIAALDGDALTPTAPSRATPDKLVDTAVASKITRRSSSWLYAIARRHPYLGWKVAGSWVFSEPMLRAFMAGEDTLREKSEICEIREAPGIPS